MEGGATEEVTAGEKGSEGGQRGKREGLGWRAGGEKGGEGATRQGRGGVLGHAYVNLHLLLRLPQLPLMHQMQVTFPFPLSMNCMSSVQWFLLFRSKFK